MVQALELARLKGVDLIEIAATANPPICRLIDFARYKYEQKKMKGSDERPGDSALPSNSDDIDLSE
jgi:translation initiation factor IF-3